MVTKSQVETALTTLFGGTYDIHTIHNNLVLAGLLAYLAENGISAGEGGSSTITTALKGATTGGSPTSTNASAG